MPQRNYMLTRGVPRFSKARMYTKVGVFKMKPKVAAKKEKIKKELYVIKPIGGDKNGGERKILINKPPKLLGEFRMPKSKKGVKKATKKKSICTAKLRKTLTPGTVVIILAGVHKGKRAVFLKQLKNSGLLLISGPMKLNNCPLRRVSQAYVIATKTKIDVSDVSVPEHVDDDYFKRLNKKKKMQKKTDDEDIFAQADTKYVVSDQRKADQQEVDKQLLTAIRKSEDKKMLFAYLGSYFSLAKNQTPHNMVF